MKKLILIRHAKSSWETPTQDKERPLTPKGILDAHQIAIISSDFIPKSFIMLSSTAKRAATTAVIFAQNLSYPIENIVFKEDLYTFDDFQLENVIKSCNNLYENVILFGHNAAITNFVNKFGDAFIMNVPTAGLVSIEFETNLWENIHKGKTTNMLFPKDLKQT